MSAGQRLEAEARVPRATYRLQLNRRFPFEEARRLVPYLDALGISDLYASSYLVSRPGSMHGYDIADHSRLNPEIGSSAEYEALAVALRDRGMGHILDVIPNHMGIADGCNRWWNDVLENGPGSRFAGHFDIDWAPVKRQLEHRVLLPILGDQYGHALESRELRLEYGEGAFSLRYYDTRLPIAPRSVPRILAHALAGLQALLGEEHPDVEEYQSIITALANLPGPTERAPQRVRERQREADVARRRLARLADACEAVREALDATVLHFNGRPGEPHSFDCLDRLLDEQVYRLAHWRVAADEINYRRFFDINELAAIRMEDPDVFRETHRLVLALVDAGHITGLRLDHPDGLYDPAGYFRALQRERALQVAGAAGDPARPASDGSPAGDSDPADRPLYLIAEKILARGERLPTDWAIHGTTGYEFLNLVNGLFVDKASERMLTKAYADFTGERTPFPDLVYRSKILILRVSMSSELLVLGHALDRLSDRNRHSRDFTLNSLTDALREVIACFPVYRTYIDDRTAEIGLQDRACIEVAVAFAKRRNPTTNESVYDFVRDTLLRRAPHNADEAYRRDQRVFVGKFQQLTAPVTAKGIEDTAFYRYNRLVSLNEVGGEPERFGIEIEEFHARCEARQAHWPGSLSATATHDTKRGEDVRARINVLSEIPREWRSAIGRWHRLNRRHRTAVDGSPAPDRNDEYLLYQTLIGAWPLPAPPPEGPASFHDRIQAYMLKATREAKIHTSWINPSAAYESAVQTFVTRCLDPETGGRFLRDFESFHAPVARLGMVNGLAQVVLKIAAPGVPDFYQGTEIWDLSLVDPDNRRPVAYPPRLAMLEALQTRTDAGDLAALARELLEHWQDGRIKMYVIHRALMIRRAFPALFRDGAYQPLTVEGPGARSLCAFARRQPGRLVVAVAPRLTARLTGGGDILPIGPQVWRTTAIRLPEDGGDRWREVFTGRALSAVLRPDGRWLPAAEALAECPVALLYSPPERLDPTLKEGSP